MISVPILQLLRVSSGFLSGEEISRRLGITRAAIWKNIEVLRKSGYKVEAIPHVGYRLLEVPDKFLPWEVQEGLKTEIFGKKIICEEKVSSTMDIAVKLASDNAAEGTVVFAEHQTKGRGRMGKHWVSPAGGGIYMSLILRPRLAPRDAAKLTLLSSVAVCEAVKEVAGVDARIKWPNDILIGEKKLAGILTEMNAELDSIRFMIVGLGINVNTVRSRLPPEAVSLKTASGKAIDRLECARRILESMESWYQTMQEQGFASMLARWRELSCTLKKQIMFTEFNGQRTGTAMDIDEDGALLIRLSNGEMIKRNAGEIVHQSS